MITVPTGNGFVQFLQGFEGGLRRIGGRAIGFRMARVFLLDNLDSFTHNLAQGFLGLKAKVEVRRAVEAMPMHIAEWKPTHLVLSAGPQRPGDHPANAAVIESFAGKIPIMGICLGMQAINEFYGGTLRCDDPPIHGKTSPISHTADRFFSGVPNPCEVARYHSLVVDELAEELKATAWTPGRRQIMGLRHRELPVWGVQFHPESFLSAGGERLMKNFLQL